VSALPQLLPGGIVLDLAARREARRARLLARPPQLPDGVIDLLALMGPDLPARDWAFRLGVGLDQVERALAWVARDEEVGRG
jgi:hypothetical protein